MLPVELTGAALFLFSTWCVFYKHFADGIVGKNLLSLGAIASFFMMIEPYNWRASIAAVVFVVGGVLYSYIRSLNRHALIGDRREKPRSWHS